MAQFIDSETLDALLDRLCEDGVAISKLLEIREGVLRENPAMVEQLRNLAKQHGFWHPEGRS